MERATELAAERDHELRNGLAGLAGITHLLSSEPDSEDHERLKQAVLAELGRLHLILDGAGIDGGGGEAFDDGAPQEYEVEPVLAGLAALRRSRDAAVDLEVEPGLAARGHSAVLAQVVTNLLANCDRHAPGTPVTIRARSADGAVAVEVRDRGPGLASGGEEAVFARGVRDEAAGGCGLGLHISRQLVDREGGTLELRTVSDPPGCLAVITLPPVGAPVPSVTDSLGR
nr:HAMP domain-containing sensor histidine kinase [Pseudonocardia acidicola]